MSQCRPIEEIDMLTYQWIPPEIVNYYEDATLDDLVLDVRNGDIGLLLYNDDVSGEEKDHISAAIETIKDTLTINGFIRPEMQSLINPEIYFTFQYIVRLELADNPEEEFLPYFLSNEEYERYNFCYERIEAIIAALHEFLDGAEIDHVVLDIMTMGNRGDKKVIDAAKQKLIECKTDLLPLLEKAYAFF